MPIMPISCFSFCLGGGRSAKISPTTDGDRPSVVDVAVESPVANVEKQTAKIKYDVDSVPPWYLCVLLGFQHYLTMVGGMISVPLIISTVFCFHGDWVTTAEIFGTMFFVSGIGTLLQCSIGCRLPIIQGMSFSFILPAIAILSQDKWQCLSSLSTNVTNRNLTLHGEEESDEVPWKSRMREIQGALILASLFEVLCGLTGLVGLLLKFIGPLTVAPVITLIGVSLFNVAAEYCAHNWWIAFMTMALVTIFSQYMRNVDVPFFIYKNKSWHKSGYPIMRLFPVVLAIIVSWLVCVILTVTNAIPNDRLHWAYNTRTDTKIHVLRAARWFRMPYPFQWGWPTFSVAGFIGMLAAVLSSIIESVGDYYACARLSGAPLPPTHAINRGICMEGIGCVLAGIFGTGCGLTSYSENVGAIGITGVASRRVIVTGSIVMILIGLCSKFGALFVAIPEPIVGGVFVIMFGMVAAVGISNLQLVDMNSTRNIFIFGFSILLGLSLPMWLQNHPNVISTGIDLIDQIATVLATTSLFVGGFAAVILDNTIPGTAEERGMMAWQPQGVDSDTEITSSIPTYDSMYDLPLIMARVRQWRWTHYIPISPTFRGFSGLQRC